MKPYAAPRAFRAIASEAVRAELTFEVDRPTDGPLVRAMRERYRQRSRRRANTEPTLVQRYLGISREDTSDLWSRGNRATIGTHDLDAEIQAACDRINREDR